MTKPATPELLETAEILLKWIIGERDYLYENYSDSEGEIPDAADAQELAEYDEVIEKAQAVIKKEIGGQ